MSAKPYYIMAGNSYLCDHGAAFAWTRDDYKARRFDSESAAKQYFKDLVGSEPPQVVRA